MNRTISSLKIKSVSPSSNENKRSCESNKFKKATFNDKNKREGGTIQ